MRPNPTDSDNSERWHFSFIVLVFVALSLAYNAIIPLGFGPDEPRHYNYVPLLVEQRKLPRTLPAGGELGGAIVLHPPLYYSVLALFYVPAKALGGPWLAQRVFRLISTAFGAVTLALIWATCRRVFLRRPSLALFIPALVALWPHFLMDHSLINNDNGANLVGALFVYFLVSRPRDGWRPRAALVAGALVGAGALMKGQLLLCLPPVLLVIMAWDHGRGFLRDPRFWRSLGLSAGVALLVSGPWYARNIVLYGRFTPVPGGYTLIPAGISFFELWRAGGVHEMVGLALVGIFRSIWAQVGWFPESLSSLLYGVLGALLGLAALGWVVIALRLRRRVLVPAARQARHFSAMLLPFVFVCALIIYVSMYVHFGAHQGGRYALFAVGGLAAFLGAGWRAAAPRRFRLLGAVLVLAFFGLLNAVCMWQLVTYLNPTHAPDMTFWTPITGT
ncbi:MAG: glycosyltransferase family 39 protein [Armatimonadota bacterium]